jgi:hypothetical protein
MYTEVFCVLISSTVSNSNDKLDWGGKHTVDLKRRFSLPVIGRAQMLDSQSRGSVNLSLPVSTNGINAKNEQPPCIVQKETNSLSV